MKTYTDYYNKQINEGFWSWLGNLIKGLFTDDTSDDTKNYTERALKYGKDTFDKKQMGKMQDLLKEKDPKKLTEQIEQFKKEGFEDENKATEWEMILLSIRIRLSNDEKDTKTVKELTDRFHELSKKHKDLGQKLAKEIKTEDVPKKSEKTEQEPENKNAEENTEQEKTEQENDNNLTELYNNHKEIIEEICNGKKIDLDKLIKSVSDYCNENKIENPKQYYGLLLTKLGSMMSEKSNEYIKNICGE